MPSPPPMSVVAPGTLSPGNPAGSLRLSPPFSQLQVWRPQPPPSGNRTTARIDQPELLEHLQVIAKRPGGRERRQTSQDLLKAPSLSFAESWITWNNATLFHAMATLLTSRLDQPPLRPNSSSAGGDKSELTQQSEVIQ